MQGAKPPRCAPGTPPAHGDPPSVGHRSSTTSPVPEFPWGAQRMAGHHRDPAPRLTHVSCQGARTPQEHGHPRSTGCKQAAFVPLWARRVPWLHPHLICAAVPSQTCRLHEGLCPWDLRNQPKGAVLSHSPSPSQSHLDPPPSCHRSAAVSMAKWMSLRPPLPCYCLQRRGKGSGEPRDRSQFKHSWKESLPSLRGFNLRFPGMD